MPPYGQSGGVTAIVAGISAMHQGRLSAAHDWFVDTPVVVALRDGQVLFAKQQADFADIAKAKAALGAGGRQSSAAGMGLGSSRLFWNCNAAPETDDSWFDHVQAGPDVPVVRITGGRGDFSFGDVRSGSVHAVVFEVTNGGTAPLKVTGVRSECPCLKARPDTMVVAPGGTGRLLVGYKAPSDVGPYQGRLLLTVDGGAPMLLTVRATVQPQPSGAYVCSKGAAVTAF
jgi:hypothetical protein